MTEVELRRRFEEYSPVYNAWGYYLQKQITDMLSAKGLDVSKFLKIPPIPRVKDIDSFIEKALYRNKQYKNPIEDITDKVGIRFVVLELREIDIVESCITSNGTWIYSKDRDFEEEVKLKPELFTYKSVHYIVRNKSDITFDTIHIAAGTPCEIQIRTLLQHGYAELSHDVQYKKVEDIPSEIKRKIARSMALIEASDELFKEVKEMLEKRDEIFKYYINNIQSIVPLERYNEMLNRTIFEAFRDSINETVVQDILQYANEKQFLLNKMADMKDVSLLYAQPIMLLIYYLIDKKPHSFIEKWPLSTEPLVSLYSDLGKCIEY